MNVSNNLKFNLDLKNATQPILVVCEDEGVWQKVVSRATEGLRVDSTDSIVFTPSEGIEELRNKINGLSVKPHSADYRLFVIYSADLLSPEQANTLLKTLEEMPRYLRTILLSKSLTRILPTIKSRCHKIIWSGGSGESGGRADIFSERDFNGLVGFLNSVENEQIPDILEDTLKSTREKLGSADSVEIYKKIANAFIKSKSTNVNRKLLMEEIFIFKRGLKEK